MADLRKGTKDAREENYGEANALHWHILRLDIAAAPRVTA